MSPCTRSGRHAARDDASGSAALRAEIETLRVEATALGEQLRAEMRAEGDTTRRHFVVMTEQTRQELKLIAEGTAHNTSRLDDHDTRIAFLEKLRRVGR